MPNKLTSLQSFQERALRSCRVYFLYAVTYAFSIVIFDSWNLITHEAVIQRWTLAVILTSITTILWFLARSSFKSATPYQAVLITLILSGILFAAVNIYIDRGMASKAVALFAIPLITAAITRSRATVLATASLSSAAYALSMVRYFYEHYGEGYRIQLYGEIFFYVAVFFVMAWLLLILVQPDRTKP